MIKKNRVGAAHQFLRKELPTIEAITARKELGNERNHPQNLISLSS